jgi:prevent-host-death family protein
MRFAVDIPAALFKAECLKLMDQVARTGKPIVITKHGKPVARLVPVPPPSKSFFGHMKNTLTITGDVVAPTDESWSAESGDEDPIHAPASRPARPRRRLKK